MFAFLLNLLFFQYKWVVFSYIALSCPLSYLLGLELRTNMNTSKYNEHKNNDTD